MPAERLAARLKAFPSAGDCSAFIWRRLWHSPRKLPRSCARVPAAGCAGRECGAHDTAWGVDFGVGLLKRGCANVCDQSAARRCARLRAGVGTSWHVGRDAVEMRSLGGGGVGCECSGRAGGGAVRVLPRVRFCVSTRSARRRARFWAYLALRPLVRRSRTYITSYVCRGCLGARGACVWATQRKRHRACRQMGQSVASARWGVLTLALAASHAHMASEGFLKAPKPHQRSGRCRGCQVLRRPVWAPSVPRARAVRWCLLPAARCASVRVYVLRMACGGVRVWSGALRLSTAAMPRWGRTYVRDLLVS